MDVMQLVELRKKLHRSPELSGNEKETASIIRNFLLPFQPDDIVEGIGGHGLAVVFNGKEKGPGVLFRCELDALPIDEVNKFNHHSGIQGVSHKCGHDGHMTILVGLASLLAKQRPANGRVILLFQPAEETGMGAKWVLEDKKFARIKPDYVFALHNLPGYPINQVVVKPGIFSSASIGLIVHLEGKTSHASEPEKGANPAFVLAAVLKQIEKYALPGINSERMKIITPVHARLGRRAFGTNAGEADLMFTIRAAQNTDFQFLKKYIIRVVEQSIEKLKRFGSLKMTHEWVEAFPNSINDVTSVDWVIRAADKSKLAVEEIAIPFRWSEDFGHFLAQYPGALFGLGAGINCPALHHPDYDFPDELIEPGIKVFYNIAKQILK